MRRSALERFWDKVDLTGDCWLWTAVVNDRGYGQFWFEGKMVKPHRWIYEKMVASIPEGLVIDHLCRTRNCVRPDHLEAVSQLVNVRRGDAGVNSRSVIACPKGHAYDEANTYLYRGTHRECRACHRDGAKRRRALKVEVLEVAP